MERVKTEDSGSVVAPDQESGACSRQEKVTIQHKDLEHFLFRHTQTSKKKIGTHKFQIEKPRQSTQRNHGHKKKSTAFQLHTSANESSDAARIS